jgi:hypothetical protein
MAKTRRHQRGAGFQTSQQFFNPAVLPPHVPVLPVVSAGATDAAIRPVLASTFKVGGSRRRRQGGAAYQTSQQFFNPMVLPPHVPVLPVVSTGATDAAIRPVLASTFKVGGSRRRQTRAAAAKGGFTPSVMGSFIPNAQAAIVPLAFYAVYHTMVKKDKKTRRSNRK